MSSIEKPGKPFNPGKSRRNRKWLLNCRSPFATLRHTRVAAHSRVQSALSRTRGPILISSTSQSGPPASLLEIPVTRRPTRAGETACVRTGHGCAIRALLADRLSIRHSVAMRLRVAELASVRRSDFAATRLRRDSLRVSLCVRLS